MRRALALPVSLACCLSALTVRAEDAPEQAAPTPQSQPSGSTPPSAPANVNSAFSILVELGDKARQRGNINDAADAYYAALQLKNDATIRGRLGLIAAQINEPVAAAADLLEAIERGGGSTTKETDEFHRAYKSVRPLVCNLHVTGNVFDAEVAIDDGKARREIGTTFKLFVTPGTHLVRGRSETRGEARAQVDCPKGGEGFAVLEWRASVTVPAVPVPTPPAAAPPAPTDERATRQDARRDRDRLSSAYAIVDRMSRQENPWGYPDPSAPDKEHAKTGVRPSIAIGPIAILGVASWAPAFGVAVSGALRLHEHFSVALEARGAWLAFGIGGQPITAMTAGGLLLACGHVKQLFGCVSGHLGIIRASSVNEGLVDRGTLFFKPGVGARLGASIDISGPFTIQIAADVVALSSGTRLIARGTTIADIPPVMVGVSLLPTWSF
jgi:hypothetical protein